MPGISNQEVRIDGPRLRLIREMRGLTQGQLAVKSGVAQGNISRWESGERKNAKISTIGKLARALEATVSDLLVLPKEPRPEELPDFHVYISRKFEGNPRLQRSLVQVYEALRSVEEAGGEEKRQRRNELDQEIEEIKKIGEERKKRGEGRGEE